MPLELLRAAFASHPNTLFTRAQLLGDVNGNSLHANIALHPAARHELEEVTALFFQGIDPPGRHELVFVEEPVHEVVVLNHRLVGFGSADLASCAYGHGTQ